MALHVLEPGLYTLIVDRGRPARRALGVPVGGAADRRSLVLGNALVGNPADAAALEITLAGPTLRADCPTGCVLFGAPFTCSIQQGSDSSAHPGTTFTLPPEETLTIGGTPAGMRAYLCVRGGFQEPAILDSRSALAPVRAGQVLACEASTVRRRFLGVPFADADDSVAVLRVLAGAQEDWFDTEPLYREEYAVAPASNRMGLRLSGSPLAFRTGLAPELVSEPVAPGAIQVTRDGQCIILGVDGQTIGGYPKIAHVISADLDRLAQLRPGRRLRFERTTLEEALSLYRHRQAETDEWVTRLRTTL